MEFNKKVLSGICVLFLCLAGCGKNQSSQGNDSNAQSSSETSSEVSDTANKDDKKDDQKEAAKDEANTAEDSNASSESNGNGGTAGNGASTNNSAPASTSTGNGLSVKIGDKDAQVAWENNETVEALKQLSPLTVQLSPYKGVELSGNIGTTIPSVYSEMTTSPGDIVLYEGNTLIVAVEPNTCLYTKVGRITNLSEAELKDLLAQGNVTITLNIQ
ncbi:MAG: hypothetical protein J6E46_01120 [Faecalicoccus sp.]|nr:hypothetical protein [Faecalicoccus sp.]